MRIDISVRITLDQLQVRNSGYIRTSIGLWDQEQGGLSDPAPGAAQRSLGPLNVKNATYSQWILPAISGIFLCSYTIYFHWYRGEFGFFDSARRSSVRPQCAPNSLKYLGEYDFLSETVLAFWSGIFLLESQKIDIKNCLFWPLKVSTLWLVLNTFDLP